MLWVEYKDGWNKAPALKGATSVRVRNTQLQWKVESSTFYIRDVDEILIGGRRC